MSGNLGGALAGYLLWKRLRQFFYRNWRALYKVYSAFHIGISRRNAHCGGCSIFQNVPKIIIIIIFCDR